MDLAQIFARFVATNGGEILPRITISGHPGSGTSTLVDGVCEAKGWSSLNGGEIFRSEAAKRGMSLSEFGDLCASDFSVDKTLDEILKSNMLDTEGPDVMESRLSGWWAYQLGLDCVRLWVEVSEQVRAERVVSREGIDFDEAIANNRKRSSIDLARYQEMYGLNPEDRTPYTHVIDASNLDTQGVLDATMEILEGIE